MSSTITYPYTTNSNYTFDSDKIEVTNGVARLILEDNASQTFTEDFADDTGFTYDSAKAEFNAGSVQQIETDNGATFVADFNTDEDANWSSGIGAGTLYDATIEAGVLNMVGGTNKWAQYTADGNIGMNQGCIRFKYKPSYSGEPPANYTLFQGKGSGVTNSFQFYHSGTYLRVKCRDLTTEFYSGIVSNFDPTAGQTYEIELNYSFAPAGSSVQCFVDGVRSKTAPSTGGERTWHNYIYIGADYNGNGGMNATVDDLMFFTSKQHTSDYTAGYSIESNKYLESKVELPIMTYSGIGAIQEATNFSGTATNAPNYIINDLYYNGSAWASSDGSFIQSTDELDITGAISTLPASDTYNIDVVFQANNTTQMDIGNLVLTYSGQIYPTDNPTILTNSSFFASEIVTFTESKTITGSDEVKYVLSIGGTPKWSNAGTVETSNDTYAESNTETEITTDIADFVTTKHSIKLKAFLHSNDGSTTPELDLNTFAYDAALADAVTPTLVDLNGYIYDMNSPINGEAIKIRPYRCGCSNGSSECGIFQKYEYETIAVTGTDGFFSGNVYVQPEGEYLEVKIGRQSYKTTLPDQDAVDFSTLSLTLVED